jgi:hypothetical protein
MPWTYEVAEGIPVPVAEPFPIKTQLLKTATHSPVRRVVDARDWVTIPLRKALGRVEWWLLAVAR